MKVMKGLKNGKGPQSLEHRHIMKAVPGGHNLFIQVRTHF